MGKGLVNFPRDSRKPAMHMTFDHLMHLPPDELVTVNRNRDRYFPVRPIARAGEAKALRRGSDLAHGIEGGPAGVAAFMAANRVAGLLVMKDGEVLLERYGLGNDETSRWSSFSVGKPVTGIMVGVALKDGYLQSLDDPLIRHLPELAGSAYGDCTVRHLLTMSSGVAWREGYRDGQSDIARMYGAVFARRRGGILDVMRTLPRAASPGTRFLYSTGETHLLGEIVARAAGRPLAQYLSERIWSRYGMEADGYWTLESPEGQELAGGGVNFVLRDYGRFGQFVLEGGVAAGEAIVPPGWIAEATNQELAAEHLRAGRLYEGYPFGYGYQWWLYPGDGGKWPEHAGAFSAMGIFGQFLYVNPRERVVGVIQSAWPDPWVADNERRAHEFLAAAIRAVAAQEGRAPVQVRDEKARA
jgi:CubicO group peptidase (beta-lactamase class C family)